MSNEWLLEIKFLLLNTTDYMYDIADPSCKRYMTFFLLSTVMHDTNPVDC